MLNNSQTKILKILNLIVLYSILISARAISQNNALPDWSFLSTSTIGAKQFIQSHPQFDGRDIVIFILDSGVDMGVAGLKETSAGKVKVIDVRDFSGQGDIFLYAGEQGKEDQEKFIDHPNGFRLYNYHRLPLHAVNGEYLIGAIEENRFQNSTVSDLNNNGKYDDVFSILAFEVVEKDTACWVVYVDTDGDQQIDDEKPLRDYAVQYDTFRLRGGDRLYDRSLMTYAVNLFPDEMKVSLHFDDDGHGTHVAGIAAGYKINNQTGLNGIASGAQIISLKVGNGNYEGACTVTGSIRKALNFVENYANEHKAPVVVNISYGIGSVREGKSDIDQFVEEVLTFNENIFICLSNGNEGPGISTTGTPAAARRALSVGALLPVAVARESYRAEIGADKIFYFSSRGGELNKPDVIAPGAASSTIPSFTDEDLMRGTSMAAPQAAGAAAILLSAAIQSKPALATNNIFLHRALKFSARPIKGYTQLDQGNGVIDIPQAFKYLKSYSRRRNNNQIYDYEISTECPAQQNGFASSAYWRTGGYYPANRERQTFTIKPVFNDSMSADTRSSFFSAFYLKATEPWLYPVNKSVYIKGEKPAKIDVKFKSELLAKPGLYCGKITGYQRQAGIPKYDPTSAQFELLTTIIVPYIFDYANNYQQNFFGQKILPGYVKRYFVLVPTGATDAKIVISPAKNNFCSVSCIGYTPEGLIHFTSRVVSSKEQNEEIQYIHSGHLKPGIWEIDIYADFQNDKSSVYDLSISFSSFHIEPPEITDFNFEPGQQPGGSMKVTNQFNLPFYGFSRGKLYGYQRKWTGTVRDRDTFSYDFKIGSEIDRVEFDLEVDKDSFLQFTDIAVNVFDSRGRAIYKDALDQLSRKIVLSNISEGSYSLEITAAFAYSTYDVNWRFSVTEKYFLKEDIAIKVYQGMDRLFRLYPNIPKDFDFTLSNSPRIPPDGFNIFGAIEFIDRNLLQRVFTVPVVFK